MLHFDKTKAPILHHDSRYSRMLTDMSYINIITLLLVLACSLIDKILAGG
ncbi:protein of unknown function [Candidatus Methylomirabilis oxygeniifera]|uniref:Uncharacterized protein n=1 Tax=Methylomirabilis oxygeniifera TaxID=671143 RepID=D5MHL4_METO1|nr:protein of unknown function [Candidatus Methylomirabilis oxyfera]